MIYEIKNDKLCVQIADKGAELQSIKTADGTEYLWQGDPAYWTGHAPNIFPYVARLTQGKYTLRGKEYGFKNHGLVRYEILTVEAASEDSITFRLDANEELMTKYPYDFTYRMTYTLKENTLVQTIQVENHSEDRMFFAVGGHPGFNVPLEAGIPFEDYYLEFSRVSNPYRIEVSPAGAIRPGQPIYQPGGCQRIDLQHNLFDSDAIVLYHGDHEVTLKTDKGSRAVTVTYPDFRYIGFWHKPLSDAPYVCIEPWTSLPSRENIIEDFELQGDLLHIEGGESWMTTWTIQIHE